MKTIYVLSMIVGALGAAQQLWDLLDLALAAVLIPNVIAVIMLSPKVKSLTTDFFKKLKNLINIKVPNLILVITKRKYWL